MWIIAKNLPVSVYVRDTLESSWDLEKLSRLLERSVMWRSKPSLARTWLQRLKRANWMQRLSGRILKPSMDGLFIRGYTSSLQVILARENHTLARDKGPPILDGFGRILSESFRQLSLFGSSEKTSVDTLALDSPKFIEAYGLWVTQLRQDCLRRRKLARLKKERECSSWPAPSVMDAAGFCGKPDKGRTGLNSGRTLTGKALEMEGKGPHANWPAPRASDYKGMSQRGLHKPEDRLINMVKYCGLLDQNSPNTNGKSRGLWAAPVVDDVNIRQQKYKQCGTSLSMQVKGKLNPDWVEQLMGLQVGWTDLGCWAMELSPNVQPKPSGN